MKLSEQWLSEWVDLPKERAQLIAQLTMAGLEVEDSTPAALPFTGVVIGQVIQVQPHPDAEKLHVCLIDVAGPEPLQIVCGAANVKPNMKVPVALPGASLAQIPLLKKATLRGVESSGMLCTTAELGLSESADGLWELPIDAPLGHPVWDWLQLNDEILDLAITPNRGDCFSILGMAREVAALNRSQWRKPVAESASIHQHDTKMSIPSIIIEAPADCPRYVGCAIHSINPQAKTPIWLAERLRRSGIRAISPVVDVTNYVLLELGQPMHAFDLAQVSGNIHVRRANINEQLHLLNDQQATLTTETLIIADDIKALAIAGVMGGMQSAVSAETRDIFLESAFFNPATIAGKTRLYGLQSDAAFRFERGVDYNLPVRAMQRAIELIIAIVGGTPGVIQVQQDEAHLPQRKMIELRRNRIKQMLGVEISEQEITKILKHLEIQIVAETASTWQVCAPSHRFDIALEIDVIEELARLYGYDNIPTHKVALMPHAQQYVENSLPLGRLRQLLVDKGYHEAITYSFVDPQLQSLLSPELPSLALTNPISPELSVMRTTLWPGLVTALLYNQNRQQARVRLFESGLRFRFENGTLKQEKVLSGIVSGSVLPEQWGSVKREVDFFDVKNDIQALISFAKPEEIKFEADAQLAALHPGQAARIMWRDMTLGWMGKLHPAIAQKLSLNNAVYLFELDLAHLTSAHFPSHKPITKFPVIRRDLAVLLKQAISFEQVETVIRQSAGEWLQKIDLFDVYQGKGIAAGDKSIAISLLLQHPARTLRDEEISELISRVLASLQHALNACLRE